MTMIQTDWTKSSSASPRRTPRDKANRRMSGSYLPKGSVFMASSLALVAVRAEPLRTGLVCARVRPRKTDSVKKFATFRTFRRALFLLGESAVRWQKARFRKLT
jgi:hypothetical protein